MPWTFVLNENKLISAIATMRVALQDDHRKVQNGICEMLELAESGIAYNLQESLQRQIATVSSVNEITGAKIDTLVVVARLIAQFTKYEFVKEEVTEATATGG